MPYKPLWSNNKYVVFKSKISIVLYFFGQDYEEEMTMRITFEENTEASQPFFLSDIIRCVRVEKLEDPAQMTIEHHTEQLYQPVHDDVVSDVKGRV